MEDLDLKRRIKKLNTLSTKRERRKIVYEWIKTGKLSLKQFGQIANLDNII